MKLIKVGLLTFFISQVAAAEVDVSLANGTEKEELKREQIFRLIEQYDLKKWWFTDKIIIDESARSPFSHPVLTLKASMPNNDNKQDRHVYVVMGQTRQACLRNCSLGTKPR